MSKIAAAEERAMAKSDGLQYVRCDRLNADLLLKRCKERKKEYSKTWCKNCNGGVLIRKAPSPDLKEIEQKKIEKKALGGVTTTPEPSGINSMLGTMGKAKKRSDPVETEPNPDVEKALAPSPEAEAGGIEVNHRKKGEPCPCCKKKRNAVFYNTEYDDLEGKSGTGLCKACYQRYRTVRKKREKARRQEPVEITCGDCNEKWTYTMGKDESCPFCMLMKEENPEEIPEQKVLLPGELKWTLTDDNGKIVSEGVSGQGETFMPENPRPVSEGVKLKDALARFLNKLCDGGVTITLKIGE